MAPIFDEDGVARARSAQPASVVASSMIDLFGTLRSDKRLRILVALCEVEELCVYDVMAVVGGEQTHVSAALRRLRDAGLVSSRRDYRHEYYSLRSEGIRQVLGLLRSHIERREIPDGS